MKNNNLLNYFSHQVNLYFDNRLTEESKQDLLKVVQDDPQCNQVFEKEKHFRNFIKNNVKRPCASAELIKIIRNKIS